ncbi:MAG: carbamoyl phosphate synthase large subunit [Thermoprotei archaeon]|nr:MAG: carbamoyl phosphate synthase large subunit [Thermoprotei archaeon]
MEFPSKVLLLGSGAIKIAEAAEFDYSGSQAIKALKEEGIKVVLVNPNIATIQTDPRLADKVYLLPVRSFFVEKVIEKERPDGILLGFGGQAALNCGVELYKRGVLAKYDVKVLGTPIEAIERASNRELFRKTMIEAGLPVPPSRAVSSLEEALEAAEELGYPLIMRVAYNLGGRGSSILFSEKDLRERVPKGLAQSMIRQVLLEKYLGKWKEIEYEVVRDCKGNVVVPVCLENVDPMGVHTGDSIVVGPSQTISNREYYAMREASIKAAGAVGIIGECNIQFALSPISEDFYVIEMNPRMSRSSALASKASGYPLAYIAAKLALGYTLPELINTVTGATTAAFEPSLDYVVVKIPRWDFSKFSKVDRRLCTQMKSVGEVMAIGRCFEEALQKAIRMLDIGKIGLVCNDEDKYTDPRELLERLKERDDEWIFLAARALELGVPVDVISEVTGVDRWFIYKIKNIVEMKKKLLKARGLSERELRELIREAKRLGFSDKQIAKCLGCSESEVRKFRKRLGVVPVVKKIDTLAAEWPAKANYLYVTYGGCVDDVDFGERSKVIVLGSSTFRIGVSVEFDWATVNAVWALRKHGVKEVIVVNCNPETVSTDWDIADKLYFEEVTLERVLDIYEKEKPHGVVVSMGGQTPNNIALKLYKNGVSVLGTSPVNIDEAEDRSKFSKILAELKIKQPPWIEASDLEQVLEFARKVGYPVVVRPSYVIGGAAMKTCYSEKELIKYLNEAAKISPEHPVVVSKFIEGAAEVEVDAVSDGEKVLVGAVIEHIEPAGVHSGDATMVIPPVTLSREAYTKILDYTLKICRRLKVRGPINIQFLVKNGEVYVIEANVRASRSMPFVSKSVSVNLAEEAVKVMLGNKLEIEGDIAVAKPKYYAVKYPQFSWMQLTGADPQLDVNMRSTGEVAARGRSLYEAFIKAWLASEPSKYPVKKVLIYSEDTATKELAKIVPPKIKVYLVDRNEGAFSKALVLLKRREVDVAIILGNGDKAYLLKRAAADYNVPLILHRDTAKMLLISLKLCKLH